jgi:hypothetical protein
LFGAAHDPIVSAVLERVTERRIGYVASQLELLGFGRADARRRAVAGFAALIGTGLLWRGTPSVLPRSSAARDAYVDHIVATVIAAPDGYP